MQNDFRHKRRLSIALIMFVILFAAGCNSEKSVTQADTKPPDNGKFVIAGSGTNLPITEKLVEGYEQKSGEKVNMPASIGSGGAIKALKDGSIDLGLISRPLKPEEKEAGLKEIAYARVGLVFGTSPSVPDDNLTAHDLVAIFQGKKNQWNDGSMIVVLSRDEGDSTNKVLTKQIPGFEAALKDSIATNRWQIFFTDQEEAEAIINTKNSFGFTDTGALTANQLPIKALKFEGIAPTLENVESGAYPLAKELFFAYKEPLSDQAQNFVTYVLSADGAETIRNNGGQPLTK